MGCCIEPLAYTIPISTSLQTKTVNTNKHSPTGSRAISLRLRLRLDAAPHLAKPSAEPRVRHGEQRSCQGRRGCPRGRLQPGCSGVASRRAANVNEAWLPPPAGECEGSGERSTQFPRPPTVAQSPPGPPAPPTASSLDLPSAGGKSAFWNCALTTFYGDKPRQAFRFFDVRHAPSGGVRALARVAAHPLLLRQRDGPGKRGHLRLGATLKASRLPGRHAQTCQARHRQGAGP